MGSGYEQQFCLRWNNHHSNLLTVFDELLQSESFTDVNFVCEDSTVLKCHRIVLAACSLRFKELFIRSQLSNESPVIFLTEAKTSEVKAIIEYMYKGEVNIARDELAGLIKVATVLKVKGLIQESDDDDPLIHQDSPPNVTTSTMQSVHSSSNNSPPHSTSGMPYTKNPYNLYERTSKRSAHLDSSTWAVPHAPMHHLPMPAFSQNPPNPGVTTPIPRSRFENNSDLPPLKRKRHSSFTMNNRDTPILRTVLGQNQDDASSPQPLSLVCHSNGYENLYASTPEQDYPEKHIKNEPFEHERSPYTDLASMKDEEKSKLSSSLSMSPPNSTEMQNFTSSPGTYVVPQKTHRYKQYTSTSLSLAIEAVRGGKMSALKASVVFNIPSRTLYDKIKKLGIIRGRPKRCSNGNNAVGTTTTLPRRRSGTNSPSDEHLSENEDASLSNHVPHINPRNYLQQDRYDPECDENETLTVSPNDEHPPSSSSNCYSSYMHYNKIALASSPVSRNEHHHIDSNGMAEQKRDYGEDDEQVEDLSIKRKPVVSRVIMSPTNQMTAILKKEELLKEALREESRREVSLENVQ